MNYLYRITGFGLSLVYISSCASVSQHFHGKQRLMALAFNSTAIGIGGAVFPTMTQFIISRYNWRGCLLILSGIILHTVPFACVYVKPKENMAFNGNRNYKRIQYNKVEEKIDINITKTQHSVLNTKPNTTIDNTLDIRHVLKSIFTNKTLILYLCNTSVALAAISSIQIFFIDYYLFKGLARTDAVSILTYTNLVSIAARLFTGIVKQIPHISVFVVPILCSLLCAVSLMVFPKIGDSFLLNLAVAAPIGIGNGGLISVISISLIKLAGQDNYTAAFGVNLTLGGILSVMVGPLSGKLYMPLLYK